MYEDYADYLSEKFSPDPPTYKPDPLPTLYRDEYGDIFSEADWPDDGRPLWGFGGNCDGDQDPVDY